MDVIPTGLSPELVIPTSDLEYHAERLEHPTDAVRAEMKHHTGLARAAMAEALAWRRMFAGLSLGSVLKLADGTVAKLEAAPATASGSDAATTGAGPDPNAAAPNA